MHSFIKLDKKIINFAKIKSQKSKELINQPIIRQKSLLWDTMYSWNWVQTTPVYIYEQMQDIFLYVLF